jgi:hypothetical protein
LRGGRLFELKIVVLRNQRHQYIQLVHGIAPPRSTFSGPHVWGH